MIRILLMICCVSSCDALSRPRCGHSAAIFRCVEFVSNYDADTITVKIPRVHPYFTEFGVRLVGIDSAEIHGKNDCEKTAALVAKNYVKQKLTSAENVELYLTKDKDKYWRLLARVVYDGHDLNRELIDLKLAVPYNGGRKAPIDWCSFK